MSCIYVNRVLPATQLFSYRAVVKMSLSCGFVFLILMGISVAQKCGMQNWEVQAKPVTMYEPLSREIIDYVNKVNSVYL